MVTVDYLNDLKRPFDWVISTFQIDPSLRRHLRPAKIHTAGNQLRPGDDKYHEPNTFGSYFAKSTSLENIFIKFTFFLIF